MAFNWDAVQTDKPIAQSQFNWDHVDTSTGKPLSTSTQSKPSEVPISGVDALLRNGGYGMDQFATTLLKAGAKYGILPGITPESVQSTFDSNYKNAQIEEANKQHPFLSGVGNAIGQTVATAPMMAIPGVAGAGISSLAALGKLGLSGANMAGQGALIGGLATQPGQDPNTIINTSNAKSGAIAGGLLGTTVGPMLSNWADKTANYLTAKANLPGIKQLSSDINSEGWVNQAQQWVTNNVLGKLPWIFGTQGARDTQAQNLQKVGGQYIQKVIDNTQGKGITALGNLVEKHAQEANMAERNYWTVAGKDLTKYVPETPISNFQDYHNIANIPGVSKALSNKLTNITETMEPKDVLGLKRDMWTEGYNLLNKVGASNDEKATGRALMTGHWDLIGDLKNSAAGTPAEQSLNTAAGFTAFNKHMLDPSNRSQLVNAIDDAKDQYGKVTDFFKWITKGASPAEQADVNKFLGKTGTQTVSDLNTSNLLNQLYKNTLQNDGKLPVVNITNFIKGVKQLPEKAGTYFNQDAISQLDNLTKVMGDYVKSQGGSQSSNIGGAIQQGMRNSAMQGAGGVGLGVLAYAHPAVAVAVTATPTAISTIVKNSPLKNIAGALGKDLSQDTRTFLTNRFGDIMSRAGISATLNHSNNSITITHRDDESNNMPEGPVSVTGIRN